MTVRILRPTEVSSAARKRLFVSALLHWFRRFGRDLPWRRTRDPYKILVSEVMLQQTQVERVKEFYRRFLETFPTVKHLANAPEEAVLKAWDGLGYYNRARNLHKTARAICGDHDGEFPNTVEALEALPGIGRYTAGAIVSFAFLRVAPIVDTNVKRVLERIFMQRIHSSQAKQQKRLWKLAEDLITPATVWEINQALMDFGAGMCTAQKPNCPTCPMRSFCVEFEQRNTRQLEIPYHWEPLTHLKAAEPSVPYSRDD